MPMPIRIVLYCICLWFSVLCIFMPIDVCSFISHSQCDILRRRKNMSFELKLKFQGHNFCYWFYSFYATTKRLKKKLFPFKIKLNRKDNNRKNMVSLSHTCQENGNKQANKRTNKTFYAADHKFTRPNNNFTTHSIGKASLSHLFSRCLAFIEIENSNQFFHIFSINFWNWKITMWTNGFDGE